VCFEFMVSSNVFGLYLGNLPDLISSAVCTLALLDFYLLEFESFESGIS
jgi:hypothetical protein